MPRKSSGSASGSAGVRSWVQLPKRARKHARGSLSRSQNQPPPADEHKDDEVWAGVHRSSRGQILLELPVEVLVRPDGEDFDDVSLRVELVGKQELERLDFELDDPHTLERSDLGL